MTWIRFVYDQRKATARKPWPGTILRRHKGGRRWEAVVQTDDAAAALEVLEAAHEGRIMVLGTVEMATGWEPDPSYQSGPQP